MSRETAQQISLGQTRKTDVRTQFGALCWRRRDSENQVLLVTSRRTKRWVLPKGWPMDGQTPSGCAALEAFEEGGVEGVIGQNCLGIYTYTKEMEGDDLPCVVAVFPLKVVTRHKVWPEADQRRRQWFSLGKAAARVQEPELKQILRSFDPKSLG